MQAASLIDGADIVDFNIDHDIREHTCQGSHTPECIDREPLLVNTVGSWANRPEAVTQVPNLFLAADYVRTSTDLATMEGANEAARRAVNGLLDAVGSPAARCRLWPLHEPASRTAPRASTASVFAPGAASLDHPTAACSRVASNASAPSRSGSSGRPCRSSSDSSSGAVRARRADRSG